MSGWENLTTFQGQGQVLFTLHSHTEQSAQDLRGMECLIDKLKKSLIGYDTANLSWIYWPQLKVKIQPLDRRTWNMASSFETWKIPSFCHVTWGRRLAGLTPKSIKSEKGHSSTSSGNIWKSQVVYRHQTMTQMCAKGGLCCRLSHTCARSSLNGSLGPLLRNQLTDPMISASSREHLVTDHGVSVPIYLHRLGRLHGRRRRWAALKCAGNKMSSSFGLKSQEG